MRIILSQILLILISGYCYGQENSKFVEDVLRLVVQNKITIYDSKYEELDNDEVSKNFLRVDTIFNDSWSRPKFTDNVYSEPFDGAIIESRISLDTVSDQTNYSYLTFFTVEHDDSGNYLGQRTLFKINKEIKAPRDDHRKVEKAVRRKEKCLIRSWKNKGIKIFDARVDLDSCHQLYRIEFDGDHNFEQYYLPAKTECFTQEMGNEIQVGVEGSLKMFDQWYNKVEGHYIENKKGRWYIVNNKLVLEKEDGFRLMSFIIKKLNRRKLHLKSEHFDYEIILKKAGR